MYFIHNMADEQKIDAELDLTSQSDVVNPKYDEPQLNYWLAELRKAFPHMPEGMLWQTVKSYSTHPHIFEDLMQEHKADPEKFAPKDPEPLRYPDHPSDE
tara:strand:+ start:3482 stop:3781 length:300 start_codon:yes stop_codon:yes gene_type:complete